MNQTSRLCLLALFATFVGLLTCPNGAHARDLHGRAGLGFNGQFPNQRGNTFEGKAISLKYGFTKDFAIEPVIGFATGVSEQTTFGLKFFKNIFYETNLNFYFFGAGAALKVSHSSSFAIQSGFGSEFFIPGLESLGISFELGAEVSDTYGKTSLRTLGLTFLESGMRFYF